MRDRPGGEIFISRPGRSSSSAVAWRYALLVELAARFGVAGLEVAQHLGALVVILVLDAGSLVGDVLRVGGEPAAAAGGTGGAEGVQILVEKLKAELADTMAMCGAHSIADIDRSMIFGY